MPRKSNAAARRQAKRDRAIQRRLRIAEAQAAEYRRLNPEPALSFPTFPTKAASVPSAVLGHRPTRFVLDIEADDGAIEALGLTRGLWA